MAQQTALDEFVDLVRVTHPALVSVFGEDDETSPVCIDGAVGAMLTVEPGLFFQVLQDPRYLAYCKEQDLREELEAATPDDDGVIQTESNGLWAKYKTPPPKTDNEGIIEMPSEQDRKEEAGEPVYMANLMWDDETQTHVMAPWATN